MFEKFIDPVFPPKKELERTRSNDFELIYCEEGSNFSKKPFNQRNAFNKMIYPIDALIPDGYCRPWALSRINNNIG